MDYARRHFLQCQFHQDSVPVRPPWAHTDSVFIQRCLQCDECITACPTHILVKGQGGFPEVDFHLGECVFCEACAQACDQGAYTATNQKPWDLSLQIAASCLNFSGSYCLSCADQCESEAIAFKPRPGGAPLPTFQESACYRCGACIASCPADAISLQPVRQKVSHATQQTVGGVQ